MKLLEFIYPYFGGHFDSSYFSFYDFMEEVLRIKFPNKEHWEWYKKETEVGFIYPLENICIISDRPEKIRMKNGLLHSEDSPSIQYTDGFSIYSLNGVRVTKELVETPAEKLDAKIILKETNAEIRREIVRKIGIERVCQKLNAKVLDKKPTYELLTLDLGDGRHRPYLKMINPSTGTFHIEGVEPSCRTVEQALNYRNQTTEEPFVLT